MISSCRPHMDQMFYRSIRIYSWTYYSTHKRQVMYEASHPWTSVKLQKYNTHQGKFLLNKGQHQWWWYKTGALPYITDMNRHAHTTKTGDLLLVELEHDHGYPNGIQRRIKRKNTNPFILLKTEEPQLLPNTKAQGVAIDKPLNHHRSVLQDTTNYGSSATWAPKPTNQAIVPTKPTRKILMCYCCNGHVAYILILYCCVYILLVSIYLIKGLYL